MAQKQQVTILDVAREANVSAGTVSNALTGKRPVSAATRQRILDVIKELGYRPNLLARGLVNQRSATLGIITSGLEYFGPSRTLVGIEQEANRLGYSLLLHLLHSPDEEQIDEILAGLTSRQVDGIIWAVPEIGNNRVWINQEQLDLLPPIVFLTMQERPGATIVTTDGWHGAKIATEHLLELGRRNIGLVTGPLNWWEARERVRGWSDALLSRNLVPDALHMAEGDWSAASGEEALYELLGRYPQMDAVFAGNDQMALGVLRGAQLRGITVPDELAVVGYDNMPEAAFFYPSLTTMRQHLTDLGSKAVRILHGIIDAYAQDMEPPPAAVHTIRPQLIVRESSRPTAGQRT